MTSNTMLQFSQHADFISHCNNMGTEIDNQWAKYIMLRNTPHSEFSKLLPVFNIRSDDEAGMNSFYNDTPHFVLNELFNMFHFQGDTVNDVFKALINKSKTGDENEILLAERLANDPKLEELKSKHTRIIEAIIDYHRNGITLEDESFNEKNVLKTKWAHFQPKYRYESIKFSKILSELASKKS